MYDYIVLSSPTLPPGVRLADIFREHPALAKVGKGSSQQAAAVGGIGGFQLEKEFGLNVTAFLASSSPAPHLLPTCTPSPRCFLPRTVQMLQAASGRTPATKPRRTPAAGNGTNGHNGHNDADADVSLLFDFDDPAVVSEHVAALHAACRWGRGGAGVGWNEGGIP